MDNPPLWQSIQEAYRAIIPTYEPLIDQFCAETGLDGSAVNWLLAALTFEPEPISPERLGVRGPYTAAAAYLAGLAELARAGYMVEVAPGEYRLTGLGRAEIIRLVADVRAAMVKADPLPTEDGVRLADLLERLVRACANTPPPPDTWSIDLGVKLMPAKSPPLPYTEQAISCLSGYRDDAHLAAWQPSGLSAPALEALTLLWRGEADSLDEMVETLSRRGHPVEVYIEALGELRTRGYIEGADGFPIVTEAGSDFRGRVEAKTDRLCFAPWDCLDADEKDELVELLARLQEGLAGGGPGHSHLSTCLA
jgi:hypothetical protein